MFPDIGGFFENIFDAFSGPSQRISGPRHRGSPIVQGYGNQIRGASRGVAHAGASVSRGALDLLNPIPQSKLEVGLMLAGGPVGVVGRSSARVVRGLSAARKAVKEADYYRLKGVVSSPDQLSASVAAEVGFPAVKKGHVRLYRGIEEPDPNLTARRRDFFFSDSMKSSGYAEHGYVHAFDVPKRDLMEAKAATNLLPHNTPAHQAAGLANPSGREQEMIKKFGRLPDWVYSPEFEEYVPMTHAATKRMEKVGSVSHEQFDKVARKRVNELFERREYSARRGTLGLESEREQIKLAARKAEIPKRSVPMVTTAGLSAREKQIADRMLRAHQWLKGRQ
ncbi:MAG: hypothetical protein OXG15_05760 [Gammaproteobacteria bacterium]|nr:hypothetical protein [Gammaproteobacteria bacterium]